MNKYKPGDRARLVNRHGVKGTWCISDTFWGKTGTIVEPGSLEPGSYRFLSDDSNGGTFHVMPDMLEDEGGPW